MKWIHGTRRMFLRGAGGAALAVPFLPSLMSGRTGGARAAGAAPRRFIAIKSYSTQYITDWYPTLAGRGYRLRDEVYPTALPNDREGERENARQDGTTNLEKALIPGKPYTYAPMSDFTEPAISRILGPKWNRMANKMLLLRGLDFLPDTNHNDGGMLGNFAACDSGAGRELPAWPTIDQVMAHARKIYPTVPPVRSLHASPGAINSVSFTHEGRWDGPIEQVQARTNPLLLYRDAFGTLDPLVPDGTPRSRRGVDRVLGDYKRMGQHPRLSAADRQTLDRHVELLASLQGDLGRGALACPADRGAPPSIPNFPPGANLNEVDEIKKIYDLMIDVIVAAVMCDRTRLFTLDARKALAVMDGKAHGYQHLRDTPGSWHNAAHRWGNEDADRVILAINQWISESVVLRLVEKLDQVEEEDGRSFLDNSIVMWGNELGFNHINLSVPTLLVGGAGGRLNTGRYIDYIDWQSRLYFGQYGGAVIRGIPYNRLLVSIMQAMGLTPADYERPGVPGFGETKFVGKEIGAFPMDYDMDAIGAPLPGLLR